MLSGSHEQQGSGSGDHSFARLPHIPGGHQMGSMIPANRLIRFSVDGDKYTEGEPPEHSFVKAWQTHRRATHEPDPGLAPRVS